jgi:glycosyltransferase involved in cell wall biosynthesis
MKILNAIHAQSIGGVDQVFRNYTEILAAKNHEVALLISDNGNDKYAAKKIFKLKNYSQIFDCLKLLLILYKFRPDVVLCHSRRIMKWMGILKFFTGAKSVAINHGISFKSSLCCDYIISINEQISDLVIAAGHDARRSFVLPNVVKIDQKYQKKILKNPPVIGIYGRLEPRKGFDILIKAGAILLKNNYDFRLKIGGFEVPGSYNWRTIEGFIKENNIAEKCEIVGTVLDKKNFFKDVDIFCVPSREEPFGLVILEGFLFSTLVISSDSDGGKLLIEDEKNGMLFINENPEDLAEKIIKILNNPQNYSALTHEAFLRLEKNFSFDSIGQEMDRILKLIS